MTDPIADMLTRIRNAQAVKKQTVIFPYSKIKWEILNVLSKNGFIKGLDKTNKKNKRFIEIILKYDEEGAPKISELKRVSKSSSRRYTQAKDIWFFKKGLGLRILSTPKGILCDKEAKKLNVGGEILLEIW
ncbi:MAG TPA: 30S ribosomal protein S8 [Candidatus Paceibacterota bacterium]|nr:30S ribosomal protein S8 [Candidatus Paceibacterota bacterium]